MPKFENSLEKVYNPNMPPKTQSKVDQAMPAAIGYVVILAVTIMGFQFFDTGTQKVVGIALLVSFTILFASYRDVGPMPGNCTFI